MANGHEGAITFDRSETHTVYDMAWSASASASASTDGSAQVTMGAASSITAVGGSRSASRSHEAEVQSHEAVIHRVDGLRVTPHWTRGDTLLLDVALTHAAPARVSRSASPDARAGHDLDVHSTVDRELRRVADHRDGGRGRRRVAGARHLALTYRVRIVSGREPCHRPGRFAPLSSGRGH